MSDLSFLRNYHKTAILELVSTGLSLNNTKTKHSIVHSVGTSGFFVKTKISIC